MALPIRRTTKADPSTGWARRPSPPAPAYPKASLQARMTGPRWRRELETVCGKAVDKLDEIMELPLDPTTRPSEACSVPRPVRPIPL